MSGILPSGASDLLRSASQTKSDCSVKLELGLIRWAVDPAGVSPVYSEREETDTNMLPGLF